MLKKASTHKPIQLLRRVHVEEITGLKRSTIYAMIKRGEFPPPVKITTKAVGWKSSEIFQWINTLDTTPPVKREMEVTNGQG